MVPYGNQTWQWNIHLYMIFSHFPIKTSIEHIDFQLPCLITSWFLWCNAGSHRHFFLLFGTVWTDFGRFRTQITSHVPREYGGGKISMEIGPVKPWILTIQARPTVPRFQCRRVVYVCMHGCMYVMLCYVLLGYVRLCSVVSVCTYVRMYVCAYVRMYVCMYVRTYVCMYVCMFVCM